VVSTTGNVYIIENYLQKKGDIKNVSLLISKNILII